LPILKAFKEQHKQTQILFFSIDRNPKQFHNAIKKYQLQDMGAHYFLSEGWSN